MGHHRLELNREEGGGWYNMYRWEGVRQDTWPASAQVYFRGEGAARVPG